MHPLVVKHLLLPVHERLLGRPMPAYLRELEESQWWSPAQLRELQQTKLRRLLRHAWDKCVFYRDRIQQAGLSPDSITLDELARLPTTTKTDIRANTATMIDPTVRGGLHAYNTGGSSGDPLIFQIDRTRQAADQAARARSRRWFGIDVGQRELYLWGSPIELAAQDRLKRFRDHLTNHKLLNAFRMSPRRMSDYIDRIQRFDPVHVFGYPSSLALLARHARQSGRTLRTPSLQAVFTTGELCLDHDRKLIEREIGVPVADGYGSREAGFIAHQCPHGTYHVTMESVVTELLDERGRPVVGDEPGEVTVTHLDAFGMPFIRYQTGDLARWASHACPCGRGLQAIRDIQGRKTDMLRTADGGVAHALSVIYVLRDEPAIRQFKVVQRPDLGLDVTVIADAAFDPPRQEKVRRMLQRRIGRGVAVRLILVDQIVPDPSGKHRYVVSQAD
jgi:phenylacetate-CoA ligase